MKKLIFFFVALSLFSCSTRKQDLRDLETTLNSAEYALQSTDSEVIIKAIDNINIMLPKFTKHEDIRFKKYKLEVKLKRYEDAIVTIDTIININERSIDHRIAQGILLEIVGNTKQSTLALEKALELLENRPEFVTVGARKRELISEINRLMVLKLLYRDTPQHYDELRSSDNALEYPSIAKAITLLENGDRARIINTYR